MYFNLFFAIDKQQNYRQHVEMCDCNKFIATYNSFMTSSDITTMAALVTTSATIIYNSNNRDAFKSTAMTIDGGGKIIITAPLFRDAFNFKLLQRKSR